MKTITIQGSFKGSINNNVILDVYRPNSLPHPYDFSKVYTSDFEEIITDLEDNLIYHIDFTGHSPSGFELKISGEIQNPEDPIEDSFESGSFMPGYVIQTEQ